MNITVESAVKGRTKQSPNEVVRDALAVAIQVGHPVMLWGAPGEGKTRLIEQTAAALDRRCEVVIGSVREATDIAGLPVRDGAGVTFVPPAWANRCVEHPSSVLFLDELTTSTPSVQAAMLRVVLDREVGDVRLPPEVSIVAAANPPEMAAGGDDLAPPLANRFCHLDWEADPKSWVQGMLTGWAPPAPPLVPTGWRANAVRWRALLAAFIRIKPSILRQLPSDVAGQGRAWPSPRTWDVAHELAAASEAAGCTRAVTQALVAGMVGTGPAIELLRFVHTADLPDPEELLADPSSVRADVRSDILLASLGGVVGAVAMQSSAERWEAAWEVLAVVCDAGRADIATLAAEDLLELREPGWSPPAAALAFVEILREAALL
mgnify:CR=1 FL=1